MNYAGATKSPTQCTSVVGWGSACYTEATSCYFVTIRPFPSVSRSVGTITRVADVKHVVPPNSSPTKKDTLSSKPSSPKVSSVQSLMLLVLLLKQHTRGKVRIIPLSPVCTHPLPHKVQRLYFEQSTTEEIISRF